MAGLESGFQNVRGDFPILTEQVHGHPLVYLDNAATMQMPRPVMEAVSTHYLHRNANVHRGVHTLSNRSTEDLEQARDIVRNFIHAGSEKEIIFTSGTTGSINLAARALSESFFQPEDEVIVTQMEHHSNLVPWQEACRRSGAVLKMVPILGSGDLDLECFRQMLSKKTKLVAVTMVSNVLGTVNPVKEIVRAAHDMGALVLLDAAQAIRTEQVDVQDLGCDFLAFSGHKIGALTGIGVLYGKLALLEQFYPVSFGGGMIDVVHAEGSTYGELPLKLESGTPNYVGAVSLGAAISYLKGIGLENIRRQEELLTRQTVEVIKEFPELELLGHPKRQTGCISFNMKGISSFDIGMLLDAQGIAVRTGHHCAMPLMEALGISGCVRVSPCFYNTSEEILALKAALERVIPVLKCGKAQ